MQKLKLHQFEAWGNYHPVSFDPFHTHFFICVVKGSLEPAIFLLQSPLYTYTLMCQNGWPSRLIYKNTSSLK